MDKYFTPIEQLRREEPDYFKREIVDPVTERAEVAKTPVMILDEGSKKIYECSAKYDCLKAIGMSNSPTFVMECKLREMKTLGEGKTKKTAKQAAAAEMLRVMVKKTLSYAGSMGIPSTTLDAALNYIDALAREPNGSSPDSAEMAGFDRTVNYVGTLQETCQKNKIDNPIYIDTEEGSGGDTTYICTCKVGKSASHGKGKKKKDAKAYAAYEMLGILKKGLDGMQKEYNENEFEEDEETPEDVKTDADPGKSLEDILADQEKFALYSLDYKILEKKCTLSMPQCLLKIIFVRNGETQETTLVFPGCGDTEEEARVNASRLALANISTF